MVDKALISVIVTILSWENNLEKCLDSLSLQTYKDLEFICVNTVLDDKVRNVLEKYAQKDKRFQIVQAHNINFPEAKNLAFSYSKGEFVSFVNSSDRVSLSLYQKFIDLPESPDIYVFNGWECSIKEIFPKYFFSINEWSNHKDDNTSHKFSDIVNPFRDNALTFNKIYRREFLKNLIKTNSAETLFDSNLVFDEKYFSLLSLMKASSIIVNQEPLYYRYKDLFEVVSASGTFDIFKVVDKIENLFKKSGLHEAYKYAFFQYEYQKYAHLFFKVEENERENFYLEMKKRLEVYRYENMNKSICERLVLFGVYKNILKLNSKEFYEKYKNKI